jgi:hypothetical protein
MKHEESTLQSQCVRWCRLEYPHITIFAIPNGGNRNAITGAIMKREGVLAGVADLFLMRPSMGIYHGLFIEMKTDKGKQSSSQKAFQLQCEMAGYAYAVCRSFDEFRKTILDYLQPKTTKGELF